jgi:hypothetical protein
MAAAAAGVVALSLGLDAGSAQARTNDGWVMVRHHDRHAASTPRAAAHSARARVAQRATVERKGLALGGAIQNESAAELARDFDSIGTTRSRWVRFDINWYLIQRAGPSSYDWAPFDRVVAAANARGLHVLGTILYTPPWARPAGTGASTPPARLGDYVSFAHSAAAHFAAMGVHAYEIWNEPNIGRFWQPKPDAARYAELLKAVAPAIRSADSQAFIVTAGLSPAPDSGGNIAPVTFLKQVYANGGRTSFDAVGDHPYCAPAYPGDAVWWSAWHQMTGADTSLRTVMAANGDAGKQIWATEFGAPTNGPDGSYVPEAVQAKMLTRAYELFRSYQWAGPLFWYAARDQGTDASTREDFYGLLRHDFSAKPAFDAYRALPAAG